MQKEILYQYIGTNGTILSPVHIEDTYYIRKVRLMADKGKVLIKGEQKADVIVVPEEDVENWSEGQE